MRTNVTFRHPAEFVGDSEDGGGVLAVSSAYWFAALLRRVPGLKLDRTCARKIGVWCFLFIDRLGIALATMNPVPVNGMRIRATSGSSGWFIYGGEPSDDPDFYQPLCVTHL